ncbi:MAG TPA: YkgJ family cysteine cluster protein [Humidesulfovibrio sp.]|uniref:YkgJ family cysteine cluster protein n=1 Tax=Humidesulfovibrio sp. TaxID=2910988 RepID=UPI002CD6025D|nr:YkgJ family cysteine cluster protein [Humidesulfovibrio sp.]HWR03920.1 YkgJ family cysteine cluster protein [Humidesulfovibrio sp.]
MNATPLSETACRRCGTCCRKGGPALHAADAHLFSGENALELSLVVTLRAGEPAFDQVRGQAMPLEHELLKLRGAGGTWTCAQYDAKTRSCGLYDRRPQECRTLSCQDTSALAAMYDKDRLRRADLLPKGHAIHAVMAEHEALVPVARIAALAGELRAGGQEGLDAEAELSRMALSDRAFRKSLAERAGIPSEYHDFFLGRDAAALFAAAGLSLRDDARLGCRVQSDPLWRGE